MLSFDTMREIQNVSAISFIIISHSKCLQFYHFSRLYTYSTDP